MKKFKKGAASFYIVSFSTLILVIIAASFATVIISAVTRASNDDLSQSAYDAALAGVEDAKLAYANYERCIQKGIDASKNGPNGDGAVTCDEIVYWMDNPDCDMVAHMIGRIPDYASGEVLISDTTSTSGDGKTSDLNQAYTCVKIGTVLRDIRANLTTSLNYRLLKVSLDDVNAEQIESVKFSWYSVKEGQAYNWANFVNGRLVFQPLVSTLQPPTPPTIQLQMIQTSGNYTVAQVNSPSVGSTTDRATLTLVPVEDESYDGWKDEDDLHGLRVYNAEENKNIITAENVLKTNSQSISIVPFAVRCDNSSDFLCSTIIELPKPIGGNRINDTFLFLVTLPYGEPDTDFAMEFLCADDEVCSTVVSEGGDDFVSNTAYTKDMQIEIDSTGRTNDLYRRVETRLESADVSFPYIYYGLQIMKTDRDALALEKKLIVTSEYNRDYSQY